MTLTGFHADGEVALTFMKHAAILMNFRYVKTGKFQAGPPLVLPPGPPLPDIAARMGYRMITVRLRLQ